MLIFITCVYFNLITNYVHIFYMLICSRVDFWVWMLLEKENQFNLTMSFKYPGYYTIDIFYFD